jgi:caspase domain-containing protein
MKLVSNTKFIAIFLFILFLASSTISGIQISSSFKIKEALSNLDNLPSNVTDDETEYWALLIAVGIYYNCPPMDRPSMLVEISRFEQMLPQATNWDASHIKIIKKEDATVKNIYNGFKWLDDMEDENDICLVYLTTHGFPIWIDIPPFDEDDGQDEALASYTGFLPFESPFRWEHMSNPFGIIIDDQFNRWFNNLESKGVGVIVDSCHSGGFKDYARGIKEKNNYQFSYEFSKEIAGQNRIVITSVPEEDVSYGSLFSHHVIDGLHGYADTNYNSQVTLEEAFQYAETIVEQTTSMDPQIFDNFPGELVITKH